MPTCASVPADSNTTPMNHVETSARLPIHADADILKGTGTDHRLRDILLISLGLAVALLISLASGFVSFKVEPELAWQFSPLGMLGGVREEYLDIESVSYFGGTLGWTFDYLGIFLKTCVLEAPFYAMAFATRPMRRVLVALVLMNLATHPIVFFVIPRFFDTYLHAALFSEAFAPLVEMAIAVGLLRKLSPAPWILLANLFSWQIGMYLT